MRVVWTTTTQCLGVKSNEFLLFHFAYSTTRTTAHVSIAKALVPDSHGGHLILGGKAHDFYVANNVFVCGNFLVYTALAVEFNYLDTWEEQLIPRCLRQHNLP